MFSVLLEVVLKLTTLHIVSIVMPNKLATLLILILPVTIWMKLSAFPVDKALPSYQGPTPEGITGIRTASGVIGSLSGILVASDRGPSRGSSAACEDSVSYRQCSLSCGGDYLGSDVHLH